MKKDTFLYNLIVTGLLPKACVVITSRPHATLDIQEHVSFRVVIIGFTMQRRREFLTKNLKLNPAAELEKYLEDHPIIDTLCHIPLNLTILVSFVIENQKLVHMPKTQTDLIRTAVEMTISHNLYRIGLDIKKTSIEELPESYKAIFYKLCTLAYRALIDEKATFTREEIETACCINSKDEKEKIEEAIINGLGLLQAAEFFTKCDSETVSTFVHFSVQELLTAWYISFWHEKLFNYKYLPFKSHLRQCIYSYCQLREFNSNFWVGKYMDMWSLYIGLTEAKDPTFKRFLSTYQLCCEWYRGFPISKRILDKKIYVLVLYMCLLEAPDNDLIGHLGEVMGGDNCLDVSEEKITLTNVDPLSKILSRPYLTMQWKLVNLAYCDIDDEKFMSLEAMLTLDDGRPQPNITAMSLRGNKLKLCGKSIAKLAQRRKVIHLYLSRNEIKDFSDFYLCELLETIDVSNNNLNKEALELFKALKYLKSLNTLKLNNNNINNDKDLVDAIGSGLCYCSSLQQLELQGNLIEDEAMVIFETINVIRNSATHKFYFRMTDKATALIRILQYCRKADNQCTLRKSLNQMVSVNLSRNGLQVSHANKLGKCLHLLGSLESLDISENHDISNQSAIKLTKGILLAPKLKQFKYDESLFSERSKDAFNMIFKIRDVSSEMHALSCLPSKFSAFVFILKCIDELDEDLVWSSDIVKALEYFTKLDLSSENGAEKLNDENVVTLCPLLNNWLRRLEVLCLKNNNITTEATEPLVLAMLQIDSFKMLEIAGNPIADDELTITIFTTIRALHERDLISLTCNQDSDHVRCQAIVYAMEILNKIRNLKRCALLENVTDLIVHSSKCESSCKFVNYIKFLPGLQCLDLSGATITEQGMKELNTYLTASHQLKTLDLSSNNLQNLQVQSASDSIKIAKFNNCNISNEVLSNLAQLLINNHLDALELVGNCFDSRGISDFCDILTQNEACTAILHLNLSQNNLDSSSAMYIINVMKACKTKVLIVSHNDLGKLLACFEVDQITTLEELDISSNNGRMEFAQNTHHLKKCSNLKKLNISNNCIDKDAVDLIYAYFISCAGLKELICENNPASNEIEVAFHLARSLHSHEGSVQSIDFKGYPSAAGTFVSAFSNGSEELHGTFATHIKAHASQVKQIDLSSTNLQVNESFVLMLKKCNNLQVLDLSNNNITDETFKHVAAGYLYTSKLKCADVDLKGNPCASTEKCYSILNLIDEIRSIEKDFMWLPANEFTCLPAKFEAFLAVLELIDMVDSEESDVCRVIFLIEILNLSYSEVANSFSPGHKQDNSRKKSLSISNSSVSSTDSGIGKRYSSKFSKLTSYGSKTGRKGSVSSNLSKLDSSKTRKLSSSGSSTGTQDSLQSSFDFKETSFFGRQDPASKFVRLSSTDAIRFCSFLKHFKSLVTINLVGNNIAEDAKDSLVTSVLVKSSVVEIQLEGNPLYKDRRTTKLFEILETLRRKGKNPFHFKDLPETLQGLVDLLQYVSDLEDSSCDIVTNTEHLNMREFYQPPQHKRLFGIEKVDNPQFIITGLVSHLKLFCNLQTLDLCNACLTDIALHKLSSFLCSSDTLQKLNISLNSIKVNGALIVLQQLDPAASKPLKYINMKYNDIEGKECDELATIICSLVNINIDVLKGNKLSERCKKLLKTKKTLPS